MLLKDKKLVILGGATGCGKATAVIAAREGASVVTASTAAPTADRAVKVIEECKAAGNGKFKHIQCNASSRENVFTAMKEAAEFMGGITGVIASQGTFTPCPMIDMTHEAVMEEMNIALFGSMYAAQAAYPYLKENNGGSIILFGAAAMIDGNDMYGSYNITKGAITGLCRTLATEWAKDYIRINIVNPMVYTEISEKFAANATEAELAVAFESLKAIKMGPADVQGWARHGKASQAGDLCAYLVSDMSDFITGQVINVDGGAHYSHT